jgi:hypothetical protein
MNFLFFLLLIISSTSFAQAPTGQMCPECPAPPECEECARKMGLSETYRDDSNHSFMFGYQYASTWVLGKKAASYTYIAGRTWSFELEYATSERTVEIGDFELGEIQEDRFTLFTKYYLTNSFHFDFGPYMYQYKINTAGSLKNLVNQDFQQEWDITGLGIAFAFGNRWQTKWGLTWGMDWVRMNYPLITTWLNKNTGELNTTTQNDVDQSFELIRKIPTFAFFTVNIGYTF